jgi:hypothetical protein
MPLPRRRNRVPLCVPGGIVTLAFSPARHEISILLPRAALGKSIRRGVKIVAVAREARMRKHDEPNEQVAGLGGRCGRFALAGEAKHHAVVDTRRDLNFDLVRGEFQSAAMANEARRFDPHAAPCAARARRDRHEAHRFVGAGLLLLAASPAFGAAYRRAARLSAAARAGLAPVRPGDRDYMLAAAGRFFEAQGELMAQICAARLRRALPTSSAEQIAENSAKAAEAAAEKIAEIKITENIFGGPALAHACMAVEIVLLAFGGIG